MYVAFKLEKQRGKKPQILQLASISPSSHSTWRFYEQHKKFHTYFHKSNKPLLIENKVENTQQQVKGTIVSKQIWWEGVKKSLFFRTNNKVINSGPTQGPFWNFPKIYPVLESRASLHDAVWKIIPGSGQMKILSSNSSNYFFLQKCAQT